MLGRRDWMPHRYSFLSSLFDKYAYFCINYFNIRRNTMKRLGTLVGILFLSIVVCASVFSSPVSAASTHVSSSLQAKTASNSWHAKGTDDFNFSSNDGVAHAIGSVQWYESDGVRKGEYTNIPIVFAAKHVCIWAQVTWVVPDVSVSFPISVVLSTKEVEDQRVVHCPTHGNRFPEQISLKGHVYTQTGLIATKLHIWTSPTKADGPL